MIKNGNFEFSIVDIEPSSYEFSIESDTELEYSIDSDLNYVSLHSKYFGPYSVTPTQYKQTLSTQNKLLLENIVVEAIPSNYGLITWNGSYLTVS